MAPQELPLLAAPFVEGPPGGHVRRQTQGVVESKRDHDFRISPHHIAQAWPILTMPDLWSACLT